MRRRIRVFVSEAAAAGRRNRFPVCLPVARRNRNPVCLPPAPAAGAIVFATLLVLILLSPASALAGSIWGMEGIGVPIRGYDLAARGAGSTAIGVADPFSMSTVNPAAIGWAGLLQTDLGVVFENRRTSSSAVSTTSRQGSSGITELSLVLPLPRRVRLGFAYHDVLDGTYRVEQNLNPGREGALLRKYTGSGGVGEISGTLAAREPHDRIAAGVTLGFRSGSLKDRRVDDFTSSLYTDTSDELRTRLSGGFALSLGAQVRPARAITLGGTWTSRTGYDIETMRTSTSSLVDKSTSTLSVPGSWGLGASGVIGRRARLAVDWNHDSWGGVEINDVSAGGGFGFADCDRFGFGLQFLPGDVTAKDPLMKRAVWRAGFSYGRLPYTQSNGEKVGEWLVSAGLGLPVQVDRGYINFLAEAGRTGNKDTVGMREIFLRLGIGATFGRLQDAF